MSANSFVLILDSNPLTGGRWYSDYVGFDTDITGVTTLFDTLKTSSVTEFGLAKCRLGPGSLGKLAEYIFEATNTVARLTIDSAGFSRSNTQKSRDRMQREACRTYTLTSGEENVDLSAKNLWVADVSLVATWLFTDAAASVDAVTRTNPAESNSRLLEYLPHA